MVNYHLEYAMLPPIKQRLKSILVKEKVERHAIIEAQLKDLIAEDSLNVSTQLLTELSGDTNIVDNEYLKCLYTIDELNHGKIKALIAKRLKVKLYNKNVGDAIDRLVYPYCRRLYLSYLHAAEQQFEQGASYLLKHDELVFLLCRAINAAFDMLMWRYFDDQPAPVDTWRQVNKLFRYAESSTLLNDRIVLFQQESKVTDFSSLYVAGLMLSTMQKGNYNASEIHIVSSLLFTWAQGATIDKAYHPNKYQFAVDISLDKGAERLRKFDPKADYRFWRTEYIVDKVDTFLKAVATNTLPKDSEMKSFGSVRVLIKLFRKLQQDWSAEHYKRQRRGSTRIKSESQLLVINGLEQVFQQLNHHVKQQVSGEVSNYDVRESTYSKMLDSHTRSMILGVDEWLVIDESVTGFGVDLGKTPSAWIDVGKLIGCKHTMINSQYFVAEIKSVKKQKNGAYRAGVKLISTQCIPLYLTRLDQSEAELSKGFYLDNEHHDIDMNKFSCLWVPARKDTENSKPSLIIPFGEYRRDRQFKMNLGGEEKILVLGKAIDIHAEWVRVMIASVH
jgi:hypothetical protein